MWPAELECFPSNCVSAIQKSIECSASLSCSFSKSIEYLCRLRAINDYDDWNHVFKFEILHEFWVVRERLESWPDGLNAFNSKKTVTEYYVTKQNWFGTCHNLLTLSPFVSREILSMPHISLYWQFYVFFRMRVNHRTKHIKKIFLIFYY